MRRAASRPITLKQYRDMASRYLEFLASGMETKEAKDRAVAEYQRAVSGAQWIVDLERFVAWRLLHLDDDWKEPPKSWMSPSELSRMSARHARWHWVNLMKRRMIDERATALGVHGVDLYSDYSDSDHKRLRAEIEAQYPDEDVCKELLTQHHNAIGGIEAPKQLPMPLLMIDQPAIPAEAMVA